MVALLVLYLPTYYDLSQTVWTYDEYIHSPMVLVASFWLFWRQRGALLSPVPQNPRPILGSITLGFGLLLYVIGRSQEIVLFEAGSQIPVLLGTLLVAVGDKAARAVWFPLFFLIFMIPLPGFLVDSMTSPLRHHISELADNILYAFGYPIARTGVALTIGPYQLEVADACSGLNSMFSLSAMGLLYLYLVQYSNRLKNAILVASIIPIAFTANLIRVVVLVLITYYFGDEVGQGFVHKFAGIVLFATALILLFMFDSILDMAFKKPNGKSAPGA